MAPKDGTKALEAKRARKKAAAEKLRRLEATVEAAYTVDPSDALAPFLARPYARHGLNITVTATPSKKLSGDDKKWIWSLLERNMRPVYGEEAWTGKGEGKDKKRAMAEEEARYLIARQSTAVEENADPNDAPSEGDPLGFVHYRCDAPDVPRR